MSRCINDVYHCGTSFKWRPETESSDRSDKNYDMASCKDEENQQPDESVAVTCAGCGNFALDLFMKRERIADLPPAAGPSHMTQLESLCYIFASTPLNSLLLSQVYDLLAHLTDSTGDLNGTNVLVALCLLVYLLIVSRAIYNLAHLYGTGLQKMLSAALPFLLPCIVTRFVINFVILNGVVHSINIQQHRDKDSDICGLCMFGLFLVVDIASAVKSYVSWKTGEWFNAFLCIFNTVKIFLLILILLDVRLNLNVYDGWLIVVCVTLISVSFVRMMSVCFPTDKRFLCGMFIVIYAMFYLWLILLERRMPQTSRFK